MKDRLFRDKRKQVEPFVFDAAVANVFDDMLNRSIPFYNQIILAIGKIFEKFELAEGRIYDLGSSTGELLCHLSHQLPSRSRDMIGIDNSPAMLSKAKEKAATFKHSGQLRFINEDIQVFEFEKAAAFISNFTLQFINPESRLPLLQKIYESLNTRGIIILCEKVENKNSKTAPLFTEIYYDFKKKQAYSELEISQKRESLENVLIPDSIETHIERLKAAGFADVSSFFQWFNFSGFIGIKNAE